MINNKFINLAIKVLEEEKTAMSTPEIWEKVLEKGYDKELNSNGKTPWATLGAYLYGPNKYTKYFERVGTRPARFVLKKYAKDINIEKIEEKDLEIETKNENDFYEKELHPILVYYASNYLKLSSKTINASKSKKGKFKKWLHPDIVGCHFSFQDLNDEVAILNKTITNYSLKLVSFELKRELNEHNLRESFFQAVSNSSWAHEGYLVAAKIFEDNDFLNELKRLSLAYGIGVIELKKENPDNSTILFPSRIKNNLDWVTITKIAEINSDFREFINTINDCTKCSKVLDKYFDEICDPNEIKIE